MKSLEDKELHIQMVLKMNEYAKKVPSDHDFSMFIFTILNKVDSNLAVYFIKEHSIKYLYNTASNRPKYTPLMIAVENELSNVVEEIMLKIKYEACNYYKEQINILQNDMLANTFSDLDISSSSETSLYTSFSKINIGDNTYNIKINNYKNAIVELEKGGNWPDYEFLKEIQNKTGYFKALEISKIKNSFKNTITDISDIFQNYENTEILNFLLTCPAGKCWIESSKVKKIPKSRKKDISEKEKEIKSIISTQKEKRQKNLSEKRSKRDVKKYEEIDLGNTRRKSPRRKSLKKKSYSRKKCPRGYISRRGYTYVKKSTKKRYKIKSTCVKSKGIRSKGKKTKRVLPSLRKGALTKYGYSISSTDAKRHSALKKALKAYGYSSLVKKLNAVKLLTKNTSPRNSKIYGKDLKWIQKINKSK